MFLMLKMYIVIFVFACTAGIIIGRLSAKNSEKAKNEAVFYNMLNSFNRIYDAVIDYLDQDLLIYEIKDKIGEDKLFADGCVIVPLGAEYLILATDTVQLRHFLKISGECIINLEDFYLKKYRLKYDEDEYKVFLEKMTTLRHICMKD